MDLKLHCQVVGKCLLRQVGANFEIVKMGFGVRYGKHLMPTIETQVICNPKDPTISFW